MSADPKDFWEKKIISWEEGRYSIGDKPRGLLEKIGDWSSRSLRFRIRIAVELIKPYVAGKRVLEVGCGSGLLAHRFIEAGAASYLGIDIAENAIAYANQRKKESGYDDRVCFEVGTVRDMPPVSQDIVFSLGVLDWLTDEELRILFEKQGRADFLHAIAELRPASFQQWLHRNYIYVCYGRKTGSYIPRYFTVDEVLRCVPPQRPGPFYVYRNPQLSFGALIATLPIGPQHPA